MLELKPYSAGLYYRYSGSIDALEDAHTIWQDGDDYQSFHDLQDALADAIHSVSGDTLDDIDIEYRLRLCEYAYEHLKLILDSERELLTICGGAMLGLFSELNGFSHLYNKEHGSRILAWLYTSWADALGQLEGGDEDLVVNSVVQRLVGVDLPEPKRPSTKAVVETLYGKASWLFYAPEHGDYSNRVEDNIWKAGLLPVQVKASTAVESTVLLPADIPISTLS